MTQTNVIRVPALEVKQGADRLLYTFAIDGKSVSSFATVSRARRTESASLEGYQRPEVLSHISEIRNYLEGDRPMIPNAVVIAFDSTVRFEADTAGADNPDFVRPGRLVIPIDPDLPDFQKPGFIVDGQQRLAAIREAEIDSFPVCVTAFITADLREQTEQFILVNSTKPLPKGLIYELLPSTEAALPSLLHKRRLPALLVQLLNHEEGSPLRGLIQTATNPSGKIKDNSMLRMIENSLSDGVLYRFRDTREGFGDLDAMTAVLSRFWAAVANVFEDAWGLNPKQSRLMHGAGIVSLGFVMDAIAERHRNTRIPSEQQFATDLYPMRQVCRWTDGYWDFGPDRVRKWNEIQNTSKDIQLLANYLLAQYKNLVWNRARASADKAVEQQPTLFAS